LLDFTGSAGDQGRRNNQFWNDMIQYTNDVNPIPGVTLKTISYDNEYSTAKSVIGYQYLTDRGAMVIMGSYPQDGEILKARLAEDKLPMFLSGPSEVILDPPGWIFATAPFPKSQMEGVLKWLSTSGWNYTQMGRKPKIGVFGWDAAVDLERTAWAKAWIDAHQNQFEWIGQEITPYGTTSWITEAKRLVDKSPDYLIVATVGPGVSTFINQATQYKYSGKYIVNWPQVAFWDTFIQACTTKPLEGAIFLDESVFYWEDSPPAANILAVLEKYHPETISDTLNVVVNSCRIPIECIRKAVETVGAENINGEAIYQASLNIKFPAEMLGYEAGFNTARPADLQRESRPAARVFEYDSKLENGWHLLVDWTLYPAWEGVAI